MQCPGCGGELKPAEVVGLDESFRCEKCGGVWAANWVVNNLADGKALKIRPGGKSIVALGKNICPKDGVLLDRPAKGTVPEHIAAGVCRKCGWWWFSGDEVFSFAQAYKKKVDYVRVWQRTEWAVYVWPALGVLIMVVGLTASVNLVRERQQASIMAQAPVMDFVATDAGAGRLQVRFKSSRGLESIDYRRQGGGEWAMATTVREGDFYVVRLEGLEAGVYEVRVSGAEFFATVK